MTANTQTKTKTQAQSVTLPTSQHVWKYEDLVEVTGLSEQTLRHTDPVAVEALVNSKVSEQEARKEAEAAKAAKQEAKSNGSKAKTQTKSKSKPTPRANKAVKLMDGSQDEEEGWVDILVELVLQDPTLSSSQLHSLAGYHSAKGSSSNAFNLEVGAAKRTIGALYRAGLLDSEMERRLAIYATETK